MAFGNRYEANYVRGINAAATLLAYDPETLGQEPDEIARRVGVLAAEIAAVQNSYYEEQGFDLDDDRRSGERDTGKARRSASGAKRSFGQRSSSTKPSGRSSGSGGGLKTSPKQEKFFRSLIDDIEDGGADPVWSMNDLEGAGSYDERQEMVDELIDQRNNL